MEIINLIRFFVKPVAIYLAALALVRIMGKRALGQLSLFDLVIMAGIGDVIVVVALERKVPFEQGLLILGLLGGLELLFSMLTFRYRFFRVLLEGKPTLLVKDGELIEANLAKEHISKADLRQEMRKQGITRINDISTAVLEACGNISVIPKDDEDYPKQRISEELAQIRRDIEELKILLDRGGK